MEPTASNRIVLAPSNVRPVSNGIIVKNTDLFCVGNTTESGIALPSSAGDKKYGIGEVVAIGPKCAEVEVGDCVVFQLAAAAGMDPIPNGLQHSDRFKLVETSTCIVCRIPAETVEAEKKAQAEKAAAAAPSTIITP